MTSPRQVIERIRRKEFLIGVELAAEAEEGANNLRVNLNNALKRLSEDLYSKDTHFVLELVQNADDNTYHDGVEPEIKFTLSPERLLVQNNEVGFSERNVLALCRVGQSTKERRAGFIGEKGIGFKSVFTATDCPEVHSNGFHFGFDRSNPDHVLGYVVPHWCDGSKYPEDITTIVLSAKAAAVFSADVLGELNDDLLLFLRKVRCITVINEIDGVRHTYRREGMAADVVLEASSVVFTDGEETNRRRRFKYVSHSYATSDIKEEKRDGVEEASIVLAFPLGESGTAQAESTCNLFSFLPVRNFGFRFLVQADFLLSANREDIHRNATWNKRARDQIPYAFIAALPGFKSDRVLRTSFLQYVPRKSDVEDPFFADAAEKIVSALRESECVLADSGEWRKPCDVLAADEDVRAIFPNDELKRILGLEYISLGVNAPTATLERLGVSTFGIQKHLLALLEKDDQLEHRDADWLKHLYRYCAKRTDSAAVLAALKLAKIIKLDNGKLVRPNDGKVYFPLQRKGRRYGFEDELSLIHADIVFGDGAQEVTQFLLKLGVTTSQPYALIMNHILPKHAESEWKKSNFGALVGHVRYIKDHIAEYLKFMADAGQPEAAALARLRDGLFLQTKRQEDKTTYFARPASTYLGAEFSPTIELESLLGEKADPIRFIADVYIYRSGARSDADDVEDRKIWRGFFYRIGVNEVPLVENTGEPFAGAELAAILTSADTKVRRLGIELLDHYWSYYGRYLEVKTQRRGVTTTSASVFQRFLGKVLAVTRKKGDFTLSETYFDAPHVRAVFGSGAVYLDADVRNENFLDAAGVTRKIDAPACFKRLDQLRAAQRVSTKDVRQIYRELERLANQEGAPLREAFEDAPRIFLPGQERWFTSKEVVWESSGIFVDSQFPPLSGLYRDYYTFFRQHLKVTRKAEDEALVHTLTQLKRFGEHYNDRRSEAVQIYGRLARSLAAYREANSGEPSWIDDLRSGAVFLSHRDELMEVSDAVVVGDDERLSSAFASSEDIAILEVEAWRVPQLIDLFEACGLQRISAAATYTLAQVDSTIPEEEYTASIRERTAAIMRLCYVQAHSAFTAAVRMGLWQEFRRFEVRTAGLLEVKAQVADAEASVATDTYRDGHLVYVRAGARGKPDKIAQELCAYLGAPRIVEGVFRILTSRDQEELDDFFEVKRIASIPAEHLARLLREIGESLDEEAGDSGLNHTEERHSDPAGDDLDSLPSTDERGSLSTTSADGSEAQSAAAPQLSEGSAGTGQQPPGTASGSANGTTASRQPAHSSGPQSTVRRNPEGERKRSRLLSYAEQTPSRDDDPSESHTESDRLAIAQAAVDYVVEMERALGHAVIPMPHNNEGFDIRRGLDGSAEYIEVKGLRGSWGPEGVVLTPAELRMAERQRDRYWLYVVEHATDPTYRLLHIIQDPFGKTNQFRFDMGWKSVAAGVGTAEPMPGTRILITDVGEGVILDVSGTGVLRRVRVRLDESGEVISRTYNPSRMTIRSVVS